MDMNLNALIGLGYMVPVALTLRKVFAPNFDMPDAMARIVARVDDTIASRLQKQATRPFGDPR